jgi:hypothetical protein
VSCGCPAVITCAPTRSTIHRLFLTPQARRGEARLQFLLKQAEIFQHFAPAATISKAKEVTKK